MTLARRFAGITAELVENVRTGQKTEGWLALSHAPGGPARRGRPLSIIEGRQKVTAARRFAGITPEVVENVRRGERIDGWLAVSHTLLACLIAAQPEHAGAILLHTSASGAVLARGDGYRPGEVRYPTEEAAFCQGGEKRCRNAD